MTEVPEPHALCMPCWTVIEPGTLPARPAEDQRELEHCCRCGSLTVSGIYTSYSAGFFACPGPGHPQPVIGPDSPMGAWAWTRDQIAEAELRGVLMAGFEERCPFCASASCPAAASGKDPSQCAPWLEAQARGEYLPTMPAGWFSRLPAPPETGLCPVCAATSPGHRRYCPLRPGRLTARAWFRRLFHEGD